MFGTIYSPLAFENEDRPASDFGVFDEAVAEQMRASDLHTLIFGTDSVA